VIGKNDKKEMDAILFDEASNIFLPVTKSICLFGFLKVFKFSAWCIWFS